MLNKGFVLRGLFCYTKGKGLVRLGKNHFTEEQISLLDKNPYVKNISDRSITYTEEFREEFFIRYQENPLPSKILMEMGLDPTILGQSRVYNISKRVKKQALRTTGFKDTRQGSSGRPRHKERTQDEEIAYLKHQVEYQKQQIDALKKINFIDKKAAWKQQHKKNIEPSKE